MPPSEGAELPVAAALGQRARRRRAWRFAVVSAVASWAAVFATARWQTPPPPLQPLETAQHFVDGLVAGRLPLRGAETHPTGYAVAYGLLAPEVQSGLGWESFEQQFLMLEDEVGPIVATERKSSRNLDRGVGRMFRYALRCGHPRAAAEELVHFELSLAVEERKGKLFVTRFEVDRGFDR